MTVVHKTLPLEGSANVKLTATCGKISAETTLVTGPAEHLSLTTSLPLSKANELQFNDQGVALRSNPKRFYVGADYSFHDILSAPKWGDFSLKVMVLASKKPSDSYGAGIGYRLPAKKIETFDLSTFSIFGAYFWTKDTDKHVRTHKPRIGISMDIKKALDFLKP